MIEGNATEIAAVLAALKIDLFWPDPRHRRVGARPHIFEAHF